MTNIKEKPTYYTVTPAYIRYSKKLKGKAQVLFGEITALCNKYGYCKASNKFFANNFGVKKRTVQNWLKNLKDNNFIEVDLTDKTIHRKISIITPVEKNVPMKKFARGGCKNLHP